MNTYVDVETTEEALQENKEVIEAIEKLGKATAVEIAKEFQPEIDAVLTTVETWVLYCFPVLLDYRDDHDRIWQDLENLALSAALFLFAFFLLAPWRTSPEQQRRRSHRWFKKQDSWSSFHASPGGTDSYSDSKSTSDSGDSPYDECDEVQQFEMQWPNISRSPYSTLALPPSCRMVEVTQQNQSNAEQEAKIAKPTSSQSIHDDDNPARRLQTYWQHITSFFGQLITFDYTGAGSALMIWIQGIRQSRQTNLDDEDNETTASLASRASEATYSVPPTVSISTVSQDSNEGVVVLAHSVLNGVVAPGDGEQVSTSPSLVPERIVHARHSSDLSTVYNDAENGEETDSKEVSSAPLHSLVTTPRVQRPVIVNRKRSKSRDALEAYRVPKSAPHRIRSSEGRAEVALKSESQREHALKKIGDDDGGEPVPGSARHFFDSAATRDSIKKLRVEASIPDTNGYVLGDEYLPNTKCTPLLVFVNSRAGPQQGHLLITQLRRLLNPIQIWDLAKGPPSPVLKSFCVMKRLRLLVCGGDGTVAWIVSALESLQLERKWPPIAILPLGTGNDLARIHGWGGGYNNESLISILIQISKSYVSLLDRWEVAIEHGKKKKKKTKTKAFFNYLGVGADAQAALQVHYLRESRPQWFFSRIVNKAWYGVFGAEDILKATSVNVRKDITLVADGVQVPLPADSQGIIVMNIDSYAGGVPLWSHGTKGAKKHSPLMPALEQLPRRSRSMDEFRDVDENPPTRESSSLDRIESMDNLDMLSEQDRYAHVTSCNMPSSCQDGVLEIVSIRGAFHLGQIKVGLSNAQRLCQCKEASIHIKHKMAVQVDGEPWRQSACTLHVKRNPQSASMLHRSSDDGGVESVMSKLLDWAEERKLVDRQVHGILMKEFSRRVESHTRQKRKRSQDGGLISMEKIKRAMGSSTSVSAMANQWQGDGGGIAF